VLFAHGSGSSRHSPRNRGVAGQLQRAGFGTLLMDLLTAGEEELDRRSRELRFDIGLLARRLVGAVDWLAARFGREARVGLFGASTGAAGALVAAAERPDQVAAVVSRGGRPDLAGRALERVTAPTLLIVGGADPQVLALNRQAAGRLAAEHRLEIVSGAGHLFEEPGALQEVARLAAAWFSEHLTG
jgi:putative phosphoribosyl transferase